jgi:hypothetical protein
VNPLGKQKGLRTANWGRMGHIATSAAGLPSSHGIRWWGRAAFAAAACALASGFAAWIVDFDPVAWMQGPALARGAAALSFDDRFEARWTPDSASIYYPPRRGDGPERADFKTEFEQIEGLLAQQSRDAQTDEPDQATQPAPPVVAAVPLPRSRPVEANLQLANLQSKGDVPSALSAPSDNRTLLQKLADLMPARLTLASLEPNGGLPGTAPDLTALGFDSFTAVYDISARAVFMPDGTKLEAHSGMGSLMDNPAHVDKPMVGATPPSVYDLKPRERLFHGVQALRMTPLESNSTLGRSGLLVHSYMLGPNGDSNGCVSIKNYDKFLKAFQNGEVKRLVVVPNLNDRLAASQRSPSQS